MVKLKYIEKKTHSAYYIFKITNFLDFHILLRMTHKKNRVILFQEFQEEIR